MTTEGNSPKSTCPSGPGFPQEQPNTTQLWAGHGGPQHVVQGEVGVAVCSLRLSGKAAGFG